MQNNIQESRSEWDPKIIGWEGFFKKLYRHHKPDGGALILRLLFAVLFIHAGLEKLPHFQAFLDSFAQLGFSSFEAYLVVIVEIVGGVFLLAGFLHKPTCVAFATMMAVAVWSLPAQANNLFWGHDYQFVIMVAFLAMYVMGPGKYSVAGWRAKRRKNL